MVGFHGGVSAEIGSDILPERQLHRSKLLFPKLEMEGEPPRHSNL